MKATVEARVDAWTDEARTGDNHSIGQRLQVRGDAGNRRHSYIHFSMPDDFRPGVTVRSAILRVYVAGTNWTGSQNITAVRVDSAWKDETITWATAPTFSNTNGIVLAVSNATEGQEIALTLTSLFQNVASGSLFFGILLTTNVAKALKLHSSETTTDSKRPELDLEWARVPLSPNDLRPSGDRSVAVSRPVLLWSFRDHFGDQNQASAEVEIRSTSDVLLYSSGLRANTEQSFNLASPPAGAPSFTPPAEGTVVKWRVRAQDGDGLTSDFSDYQRFRFDSRGALTISSPAGSSVAETTPPVTWAFTGRTQEQAEVSLWEHNTEANRFDLIHRLSRRVMTQSSYTVPENLITKRNRDYKVRVRTWDTLDRESLPSADSFVEATRVFQYQRSGVPEMADNFVATPSAINPSVHLQWTRPTRPDYFALKVDDKAIDDRLEPNVIETSPGGSTYAITYWGAQPGVNHVYDIVAVTLDAGVYKESNPETVAATVSPIGIWLMQPELDLAIPIMGKEQPSEVVGESATTFEPIGRRSPVRITDSVRGYEGSVSGLIIDHDGVTADSYRDTLMAMKANLGQEHTRIAFGRRNFPIILEEIACPPSAQFDGYYEVSVAYRQSGEFVALRR